MVSTKRTVEAIRGGGLSTRDFVLINIGERQERARRSGLTPASTARNTPPVSQPVRLLY